MGAWLCFEDESGQGLRPPKGRTWGRRGHTPVVKVTARNSPRLSLAALIATKPGHRPRLIYRTHHPTGRDRRKGFTETDYIRLMDAAHQQLMATSSTQSNPSGPTSSGRWLTWPSATSAS